MRPTMDVLTFVPAVATVLATTGSTNTPLARSGAQPGFLVRPRTIQYSAAVVLLTFSAPLGAAALG